MENFTKSSITYLQFFPVTQSVYKKKLRKWTNLSRQTAT